MKEIMELKNKKNIKIESKNLQEFLNRIQSN